MEGSYAEWGENCVECITLTCRVNVRDAFIVEVHYRHASLTEESREIKTVQDMSPPLFVTNARDEWRFSRVKIIIIKDTSSMPVAGTRRLCRMGLVAVLVTALCILTLLDSPPARLPDPPTDPPPTPGKQFSSGATTATLALLLSTNGSPT